MGCANVTIALLVIVIIALYAFFRRRLTYWERTNFPYMKPTFPFGNVKGMLSEIHMVDIVDRAYKQMKGKGIFGGIYLSITPGIIPLDLDFIKTILVRDYNYFNSHGVYYNERDDPVTAHLIALNGPQWKAMREKLTPTFTPGKMKFMYPTFVEVANRLHKHLDGICDSETACDIECKDLISSYTADIIGSCAFGIECNSFIDSKSEFKKMGQRAVEEFKYPMLIIFIMGVFKKTARFFRMKMYADDIGDFFCNTVRRNIEYREENNVQRNDFLDILIKMKNSKDAAQRLTLNEIAAQSFLFFVAGFETSATTVTMALHELAQHLNIQDKAREEISNVLKEHSGDLSYEAISQMNYIDMIIFETLRKYPPVGVGLREVTQNYTVPNENMVLKVGTPVWIPVKSIHYDPEYYPDPMKFDPERFHPSVAKNRNPMTFQPFGEGPRACLGLRFAMLQTRLCLVKILMNYDLSVSERTVIPMKVNPKVLLLTPEGGSWIKIKKRKIADN